MVVSRVSLTHCLSVCPLQVTKQMKKLKQSYGAPVHSSNAGKKRV